MKSRYRILIKYQALVITKCGSLTSVLENHDRCGGLYRLQLRGVLVLTALTNTVNPRGAGLVGAPSQGQPRVPVGRAVITAVISGAGN